MSVVLAILGWCLAAAVAVLVAGLLLPLRLELKASFEDAASWSAVVRPFGRFGPPIRLRSTGERAKRAPDRAQRKRKKRSAFRGDPRHSVPAALRLATDLLERMRVRVLSLHLRFGCDDPADTGWLYGLMAPVVFGSCPAPGADIRVEPDFDRALFSGHAALVVSVVPLVLLPPLARFGWALAGWHR